MGLFIKNFMVLSFMNFLVLNCAEYKSVSQINLQKDHPEKVEYKEIRRLNLNNDLKEYTVITSTKEMKELYMKFNDSKYSRSAPIPVLQKGEYFLILKPGLKKIKYGDIQIEKMETNGSVLNILYKEIENWEYAEKEQSHPILILKVIGEPKEVKLTTI
ncbi:hypothetical protein ACM46_17340 [Chryseobacterium angstadtii]|uniref:Uncharacterized protein n=2 Tax=Chryseobacterium angstadtii TaxID=558151 RepID=A0A0J7KS02_9FLAO|nr:hypothetical protein ACM46_17340 [Chryseobacterium angstadtii]